MLTLLVSGAQGCGRTSLKNLLLYELTQRSQAPPLVVEFTVAPVLNRAQTALSLARMLARQAKGLNSAAATAMATTIETWKNDIIPGAEPLIDNLFGPLKEDIQARFSGASVIIFLDALNHAVTRDTAQACAAMLQGLSDFVILALTDNDDARFIRSSCIMHGQPVALIDAPKVGLATVREFLKGRLAKARMQGITAPDALHPFTDDALLALLASSNPHDRQPISLPIRVAIQKLANAIEKKCAATTAGGAAPGVIGGAEMRAALGV